MTRESKTNPKASITQSVYELGVFGLVGKTFGLWRRNLIQYIVIVGVTGVALVLIQALSLIFLLGSVGPSYLDFIGTAPLDSAISLFLTTEPFQVVVLLILFFLTILGLLVYSIVAGAAINYAVNDYTKPGSGNISESFSFAFDHAQSLVGTQLLQSLIIVGLSVLALLSGAISSLVMFAMIFLILYIAVRLSPALATVVTEDQSTLTALSRSWQITGGFFSHVFFAQILMSIAVIVVDLIIGIIAVVILVSFIPSMESAIIVATITASLILSPLNYIYLAVLYKDLEARGTARKYVWWE
ncbi:MAG: hypothetical protein ACTSSE_06390 [Candidatus Thorarchaeota archaeon]